MSAVRRRDDRTSALEGQLAQEIARAVAEYDESEFRIGLLQAELRAAEARRDAASKHLEHLGELAHAQGIAFAVPVQRQSTTELPRKAPRRALDDNELSGAALREAAVRAALRRGEIKRPVHHREWLAWLRADGFEPAGKTPENVFLTQIGRSPLVRRGASPGMYIIDPQRVPELQEIVRRLHEQLGALPPPDQMSILGDDERRRRQELQAEITRTERLLQEAWRVLSLEPPPGIARQDDGDDGWSARAWLEGSVE